MRKQFPACQKMEQQKLEATAASKALLVIINTKSFQKQQQPQFPTEKKKNGEAGASSSTKITTNFGLRPNQYTPGVPVRRQIQDGGRSKTFLIGSAFKRTSWRHYTRGRSLDILRCYRHLGDF